MTASAIKPDTGEPIGVPFVCLYRCPSKSKTFNVAGEMAVGDAYTEYSMLDCSQKIQNTSIRLDPVLMDSRSYLDGHGSQLVSVTSLMDEDPSSSDAVHLFSAFHSTWRDGHCPQLEIPSRFSELCCTAIRRLPNVAVGIRGGPLSGTRNTFEMLQAERDTWTLIAALYADRFDSECQPTGISSGRDEFTAVQHSEREIVRLLYEKDAGLREAQMIIDWLERRVREQIEEVAEKYECLFNQSIGWESTAHAVNYLSKSELKAKKLINELHPDALFTSSYDGCLAAKDQLDENRYLNYLFLCVRGGDLQRAQRLCMQRGEFWRAVFFEGWRPFHFSDFMLEPSNGQYNSRMDQDDLSGMTDSWQTNDVAARPVNGDTAASGGTLEGNTTRVLFKSVCWWNAQNPNLPGFERAIYAALSGNLQVLVNLLPASWTDLIWAHCRALVEARVDSSLRQFLNTGPRADTLSVLGRSFEQWSTDGGLRLPDCAWELGEWSLEQVFSRVEAHLGWSALGQLQAAVDGGTNLVSVAGVRRCAAVDFLNEPGCGSVSGTSVDQATATVSSEPSVAVLLQCIFYAVQRAVALRDYGAFMHTLAKVIPRLTAVALGLPFHATLIDSETGSLLPPDLNSLTRFGGAHHHQQQDATACHVLRFLSHLVLFLQSVEPDFQVEYSSQVMKAYLSYLMVNRRTDLIADYTATLPSASLRIQWYSTFIAEITQPDERNDCLRYASSAGFEIPRLTRAVVCLLNQRHRPVDLRLSRPPAISSRPISSSTLPSDLFPVEGLGRLTEKDRKRIVAMDWLFYEPNQRGEALVVANSLLRVFVAMNCLAAAQHVLSKLPLGTLSHAKLICRNSGSPVWLVNTVREHECLLLYLESRECFVDWFKQVHSNRPVAPNVSDCTSDNLQESVRSITHRLQADEARKAYEARVHRWHHEVRLDSHVAAGKLLALLTYAQPGWLVDLDQSCEAGTVPNDLDPGLVNRSQVTTTEEAGIVSDKLPTIGPTMPTFDNLASDLGESSAVRLQQLTVLREMCIPDTAFLLLRLYKTAGMHNRCVDLVNLIVSNDHGLFRLFSQTKLNELRHQVADSMEHLIAAQGCPLGFPVQNSIEETGHVPTK